MSSGLLVSVLVGGLGIGGAVGYIAGAATKKAPAAGVSATAPAVDTPLFVYEKETFSTSNLPSQLQTTLYQADLEAFNQKQAIIREFIVRVALAKEQKKFTSLDKVPGLDELLPAANVTDDAAKKFFEANKDKVPPGATYDQLAPRIKEILGNEERAKAFNGTLQKLQADGKVEILAKEPASPLVNIPVEQFPAKGNEKAANVLVEVSDYLCPHCQEMHPQVKEILGKLGDKVKFVQINFSLRPQQLSGALSEGGFCAQKQGTESFWKYHEIAFAKPVGTFADAYDVAKVKPIAEQAGLNLKDWEACMASQEPKQWIQKTRDIVGTLGVTGTPTFFLNNKRLNLRNAAELAQQIQSQIAG